MIYLFIMKYCWHNIRFNQIVSKLRGLLLSVYSKKGYCSKTIINVDNLLTNFVNGTQQGYIRKYLGNSKSQHERFPI